MSDSMRDGHGGAGSADLYQPPKVTIGWNEHNITMSKAGWIAAARRLAQVASQAWDAGERFGHQPRLAPLHEWFASAIAARNACIKELAGADDIVQFGRVSKDERVEPIGGARPVHTRTFQLPNGPAVIAGRWEDLEQLETQLNVRALENETLREQLRAAQQKFADIREAWNS